ncbi:hypothetical protein [Caudoviricetes sp.]|nr:hypothetical protein [Caudoviricetes sp.]
MAATPTSALGFQNFFQATLTGDITASSTDIFLDTIPNASEGFLVIEPDSSTNREVIFYNSKTSLKVVCPSAADGRGQDDTSAAAHSTGATVIMAPVAAFWEAFQAGLAFTDNVINTSKLKTASEFIFDYVASGCVWSGDSYGSTRAASMTSGVVYISGKRITVSAVTARTFTASKDTYVDVDGTGALTYTEVINNAASPSLAAGSLRLGIIITGASSIANSGSVNQGESDKVLPIASSIPYTVTDSLGNLICPRDPNRKILGYRAGTSATSSTTYADLAPFNFVCNIPTGRKVRAHFSSPQMYVTGAVTTGIQIVDVTAAATIVDSNQNMGNTVAQAIKVESPIQQPAGGVRNYKLQGKTASATLNLPIYSVFWLELI